MYLLFVIPVFSSHAHGSFASRHRGLGGFLNRDAILFPDLLSELEAIRDVCEAEYESGRREEEAALTATFEALPAIVDDVDTPLSPIDSESDLMDIPSPVRNFELGVDLDYIIGADAEYHAMAQLMSESHDAPVEFFALSTDTSGSSSSDDESDSSRGVKRSHCDRQELPTEAVAATLAVDDMATATPAAKRACNSVTLAFDPTDVDKSFSIAPEWSVLARVDTKFPDLAAPVPASIAVHALMQSMADVTIVGFNGRYSTDSHWSRNCDTLKDATPLSAIISWAAYCGAELVPQDEWETLERSSTRRYCFVRGVQCTTDLTGRGKDTELAGLAKAANFTVCNATEFVRRFFSDAPARPRNDPSTKKSTAPDCKCSTKASCIGTEELLTTGALPPMAMFASIVDYHSRPTLPSDQLVRLRKMCEFAGERVPRQLAAATTTEPAAPTADRQDALVQKEPIDKNGLGFVLSKIQPVVKQITYMDFPVVPTMEETETTYDMEFSQYDLFDEVVSCN